MAGEFQSVGASLAVRNRLAQLANNPLPAGTLTKWGDADNQDPHWEFIGNGETTATQFVKAVTEREVEKGNQDLTQVAGKDAFAQAAASALLNTATPDDPIKQGDVKELSLKELVAFVSPFLRAYEKYHKETQSQGQGTNAPRRTGEVGPDERAKVATGQVNSQGLQLPLD